jgi:Fe2+ transport system protein B
MTERRPSDGLDRNVACGLWAGLAAVVLILVVVVLVFFGLGLRG